MEVGNSVATVFLLLCCLSQCFGHVAVAAQVRTRKEGMHHKQCVVGHDVIAKLHDLCI